MATRVLPKATNEPPSDPRPLARLPGYATMRVHAGKATLARSCT